MKAENNELADMITTAIERSGQPMKAIAGNNDINVMSLYSAARGTRQVPAKVMRAFSRTNLIAALSMALQGTGLTKLFRYRKSDRHIQARIVEWAMTDKAEDEAMENLPMILFNKKCRKDLTEEDVKILYDTAGKLITSVNVMLNLLMEFDAQYELGICDMAADIEKPPACNNRRSL